jgi:hypothetical protein
MEPDKQEHKQKSDQAKRRKRVRGKPFTKGDPRIAPLRRKAMEENGELAPAGAGTATPTSQSEGVPGGDDGVPQQLLDMRHVYARPASEDKTPGHRTCRAWMKKDPARFMAKKSDLEEAVLARPGPDNPKPGGATDEEPDQSTEHTLALVRGWLEGQMERAGQKDAAFAARPDAAMLGASLRSRLEESTRREGVLWDEVRRLRQQVVALGGVPVDNSGLRDPKQTNNYQGHGFAPRSV